ncbi:hypothetical protein PGB28_14190 [Primorskyibacter aestuariivivens]|uniref:hypothetical protein n=1 Tax=Primorskyibacter aestuariivivens TaxID=1888912 RepID=UPI002300F20C|nr:hypothetical protein [Primorskyibacter aestuariivivens]MDA7429616.1 hypothetical protein [Primorskyibacter aestuariivivens]
MSGPGDVRDLMTSLEESLDLLRDYTPDEDSFDPDLAEPMPTLLEQCANLAAAAPREQPLRSIHHMACTGGSLMCKAISVMPNVTLLSEIDPLSHMGLPQRNKTPQFRPSDLIFAGRVALRPINDEVASRVGLAALEEMRRALSDQGRLLCLRDHAHSQYCTRIDPESRPSLYDILRGHGDVISVVSVRHPMDSFLSLRQNAWVHFSPDTLEEYALRYMMFLDHHADLRLFRYEDFVAAPETVLNDMCDALQLPYQPGMEAILPAVRISGDSGRSSNRISPRSRRPVPAALEQEARDGDVYRDLCARLGYDA